MTPIPTASGSVLSHAGVRQTEGGTRMGTSLGTLNMKNTGST